MRPSHERVLLSTDNGRCDRFRFVHFSFYALCSVCLSSFAVSGLSSLLPPVLLLLLLLSRSSFTRWWDEVPAFAACRLCRCYSSFICWFMSIVFSVLSAIRWARSFSPLCPTCHWLLSFSFSLLSLWSRPSMSAWCLATVISLILLFSCGSNVIDESMSHPLQLTQWPQCSKPHRARLALVLMASLPLSPIPPALSSHSECEQAIHIVYGPAWQDLFNKKVLLKAAAPHDVHERSVDRAAMRAREHRSK